MILLGELSLWVALLMAVWAALVSFAGGSLRRADLIVSGERAIYAAFGMTVLASAGLWTAIFASDFSIKYVASFSSANLPGIYKFTAFWAGQAGSLLFWALILGMYSVIAVFIGKSRMPGLSPYVTGTLAVILVFLLGTLCLGANPFERLDWIPLDGRGMNPQLQNPGMAIHPTNLYLGYVGTSIPFAFAIAALLTRRLEAEWLATVRRWSLLAWFFTTIGIIVGMWWAYVEPEGGGYWALDPVENASLLPWLTNSAFLYLTMVQEKRGMLRKWNVTLVVSTFLLSLFGTFIAHSGIVSAVHSFAQSPVGNWIAGFLVACIILTAWLVTTRLKDLETQAELPLVARNRRRYGGYVVSTGIVVIFAAFAGLAFRTEFDVTLKVGESKELVDPFGARWKFVSQGVSRYEALNREVVSVALDTYRNDRFAGVLASEKRQHVDSRGQPTFERSTEVAMKTSAKQDVYVVLAGFGPDEAARLRIAFNPLVVWVWIGGALLLVGGLIMMWPLAATPPGMLSTTPGEMASPRALIRGDS